MNNLVIDKCEGCSYIMDRKCSIWLCPSVRWKLGVCPNATHVDRGTKKVMDEKVRVGQQKQKKKK